MRIGRSQGAAAKHQHRDEQHAFAAEGGRELSGQQIPLFAQRRGDIADDGGIETVQQGNEETQGEDQDLVGGDPGAIDDFADASGIWAHGYSTVIRLVWAG